MMKHYTIGGALALALLASTALAQTDTNGVAQIPTVAAAPAATATSPDRSLVVTIALDNDGRPTYAVTRKGKPVLNPGKLGVMFTDAPKIERNLELIGKATASADSSWTQPFGEWKTIRDRHNELGLRFREKTGLKREMDVTFRIFDDGIGFRYSFPDQPNLHQANIADELTEFAFAQNGTAWWRPALQWNREEYLYEKTPLDAVGTAQTVMTVKLADGTHVAVHEAALIDYAAMNLARSEGNTFKAALTPGAGAPKVVRTAPFTSPWRTVILQVRRRVVEHDQRRLDLGNGSEARRDHRQRQDIHRFRCG
jgi:alpha-glucosidase